MNSVKKYHINNADEVHECRASLIPCKFSSHYTNIHEAETEAEKNLQKKEVLFQKVSKSAKLTKNLRVDGILTKEKFDSLDEDSKRTILAAINRIYDKNDKTWEALYDSTPAGQLYLSRYTKSDKQKRLETADQVSSIMSNSTISSNQLNIASLDKELKNSEFSGNSVVHQSSEDLQTAEKKLTLLSATWMSNLSAEEIDTINWITGHGSGILNKHIAGEEHSLSHQYSKEFLDKKTELFKRAMAKAPVLDEPIVIYRGTKYKRRIENELNTLASSSYDSETAKDFTKNKPNAVIMEIRTRKIPSVIAMSEYGTEELEVFAPLGKYKNVGERTLEDGTVIVQIEYIDD